MPPSAKRAARKGLNKETADILKFLKSELTKVTRERDEWMQRAIRAEAALPADRSSSDDKKRRAPAKRGIPKKGAARRRAPLRKAAPKRRAPLRRAAKKAKKRK